MYGVGVYKKLTLVLPQMQDKGEDSEVDDYDDERYSDDDDFDEDEDSPEEEPDIPDEDKTPVRLVFACRGCTCLASFRPVAAVVCCFRWIMLPLMPKKLLLIAAVGCGVMLPLVPRREACFNGSMMQP